MFLSVLKAMKWMKKMELQQLKINWRFFLLQILTYWSIWGNSEKQKQFLRSKHLIS